MRIAVTGATGFVGSYLVDYLLKHTEHEVVALSRSEMNSQHSRLTTCQFDLYSLLEAEKALKGCDVAIYLIHSMAPSSRLSQGSFQDFDFILADNFAKAAEKNKVEQIVYVSGLIDEANQSSMHLSSRLEVENTFFEHKTPTTVLRCGIVLGAGGSSFSMLKRLLKRLWVIGLPAWTQTKTQVISISDLVKTITYSIENTTKCIGSYDLAGSDAISYAELFKRTSKIMGLKRLFLTLPWIPVSLSKLWIRLITGHPKRLVYPLVESLVHDMMVKPERKWPHQNKFQTLDNAIREGLNDDERPRLPAEYVEKLRPKNTKLVQSVQRLPVPKDWTMKQVAKEYMIWLPRFLSPFLRIVKEGDRLRFYDIFLSKALMVLEFSQERTSETREFFYIVDGLLVNCDSPGRFEFRECPDKKHFIAAIHNYHPRLPWYLYRFTQAIVHLWTMIQFGKYLSRKK